MMGQYLATEKPAPLLIRSKRKTLILEIKQGELLVRAPQRMSQRVIDAFIESKMEWIVKHQQRYAQKCLMPSAQLE